jgi:hypothetical protein
MRERRADRIDAIAPSVAQQRNGSTDIVPGHQPENATCTGSEELSSHRASTAVVKGRM